jgi:DNA-directed RNA polymerase II subunit RPB1
MGGREGLVDTAVKTASTGYIQRRLVKAEEGLQVRYDNTVRNTKDQIVQFHYGGDSFDAVFVERHELCTFAMSDEQVWRAYTIAPEDVTLTHGEMWSEWEAAMREEVHQLLLDRDALREAKLRLSHAPNNHVFVTVTPTRCLLRAPQLFPSTSRVTLHRARTLLDQAYRAIASCRPSTCTFVTLAYLRTVLSLKAVVVQHQLSADALQWLVDTMVSTYRRSLTCGGEMVGTLGAASIGEPCTQMTLNTFHTAGVAEKTVTLGVPRLKELIDTSRDIRTPSLSIFFTDGYEHCEHMARMYAASMQHTLLHHVVLTSSVELDPDVTTSRIAEDAALVAAWRLLQGEAEEMEVEESTKYIIRLVLSRDALASKHLNVTHVAAAVQAYLGENAEVIRSEVNMMHWVVRVRLRDMTQLMSEVKDVDSIESESLERAAVKTVHDYLLDNVAIGGVPGIKRVSVREQQLCVIDATTHALTRRTQWVADTDGTNFRAILALPFVNKQKTIGNDIHEILDVLGIEAAQQVLVEELRAVLSFDGSYVNERHLQLLVDVMTLSGTLTAMTRHSMHKLGGSTYHHASFEETQDVLIQAAAFGTYDGVTGVTENLMMGQLMPGGTGACDLILPPDGASLAPRQTVVKPLLVRDTTAPVKAVKVAPLFQRAPETVVKPLVKPLVVEKPAAASVNVAPPVHRKPRNTRDKTAPKFIPLSPQMHHVSTFVPLSPVSL